VKLSTPGKRYFYVSLEKGVDSWYQPRGFNNLTSSFGFWVVHMYINCIYVLYIRTLTHTQINTSIYTTYMCVIHKTHTRVLHEYGRRRPQRWNIYNPGESEARCIQCALTGIYNATVPDLGLMLYIDIAIQPGKAKGRRSCSCY